MRVNAAEKSYEKTVDFAWKFEKAQFTGSAPRLFAVLHSPPSIAESSMNAIDDGPGGTLRTLRNLQFFCNISLFHHL